MRFYSFIALLFIALILDLGLLAFGLVAPAARLFAVRPAPVAQAAARPAAAATPTRPPTPQPSPTAQASQPTAAPSPTNTPSPTAVPTNTPSPTPPPTATPAPQLLGAKSVSFTPSNRAVRANIRLALAHYDGALTHVVLAPGSVFSFNATLGARPQRLPWKYVVVKPTPAPTPEGAAPGAAPAEPDVQS